MTQQTPQDSLHEQISEAVTTAHREWMRPGSDSGQHLMTDAITLAVIAVIQPKLEFEQEDGALLREKLTHRRAAFQRVRALHERIDGAGGPYCDVCSNHGDIGWPCATLTALDGDPQ